MKLKINRRDSFQKDYEYCYIISCTCDGPDCLIQIFDNFIQIDDFEEFSYWFEQQIYYLTDEQFKKIDGVWLRMLVKHFAKRNELLF